MQMSILHIARYALLATLLVFNLIVLGISANLTNISRLSDGFTFVFEGLCVAASVLTYIVVIPALVTDYFRRGAFTSLVVVELVWVFVLMILWIAAAGETSATPLFLGGCQLVDPSERSNCEQFQALQVFAWLNALILFGWFAALSSSAAITHNRGNPGIWTSPLTDTEFFVNPLDRKPTVAISGYPPQQTTQGYVTQNGP